MTAIVVPPTAGRAVSAAAGLVTWKLAAEATGGALALFEQDLAPGAEIAMRSDASENRAIYVLAGEILLVGERRLERLPAGSFAWIPKGARHGFMNASEEAPARLLALQLPGAARAA